MGLAERRAITAFQENIFPSLKKEIDAAACFDVPMSVDWESLAADAYGDVYEQTLPLCYFYPVRDAFKAICIDKMGKDALAGALKMVKILNSGAYSTHFSFEDGVLIVDHAYGNEHATAERAQKLTALLESKL